MSKLIQRRGSSARCVFSLFNLLLAHNIHLFASRVAALCALIWSWYPPSASSHPHCVANASSDASHSPCFRDQGSVFEI